MRRLLFLMALLGGFAASPADALLGTALNGVGVGTLQTNDGLTTCPDSPIALNVVYLPPEQAVLHAEVPASCLGTLGTSLFVGRLGVQVGQPEPLLVDLSCRGSEAAGLHCDGLAGATADLGPHGAPGDAVTFALRAAFRFDGSVTAV